MSLDITRIINGKRYDTGNAKLVAGYKRGYSQDDFNFIHEELYRTSKGAWFLAGEGGASSKYSDWSGDGGRGSEGINVITAAEALAWLEEHQKTDAIEAYFGDVVEDA